MTTTPAASADTYAHAVELFERIHLSRAATADALDQLRLAAEVLPALTLRTLDRVLTGVALNLADAERVAHPSNVGAARLVDALAREDERPHRAS